MNSGQAAEIAVGVPTDRYYLKAMNCPHHHRIFAAEPRSYRDLPLRLAEYGTCYRYEQIGRALRPHARALAEHERRAYLLHARAVRAGVQCRESTCISSTSRSSASRNTSCASSTHDPAQAGTEVRQRTGAMEADRRHGPRRPEELSGSTTSRCRTKRRFTARRLMCRSGA